MRRNWRRIRQKKEVDNKEIARQSKIIKIVFYITSLSVPDKPTYV